MVILLSCKILMKYDQECTLQGYVDIGHIPTLVEEEGHNALDEGQVFLKKITFKIFVSVKRT